MEHDADMYYEDVDQLELTGGAEGTFPMRVRGVQASCLCVCVCAYAMLCVAMRTRMPVVAAVVLPALTCELARLWSRTRCAPWTSTTSSGRCLTSSPTRQVRGGPLRAGTGSVCLGLCTGRLPLRAKR